MDGWKGFWATFGVVSALIATIAYSALLAYPENPKEPYSSSKVCLSCMKKNSFFSQDALRYGYGVCVGSSFVFSMISVISSTLFYVQVDKLPPDDEEITFGFIEKYEFVMGTIPVACFILNALHDIPHFSDQYRRACDLCVVVVHDDMGWCSWYSVVSVGHDCNHWLWNCHQDYEC